MTLQDVADYLQCSYATVLLLVMRHGLSIFRVGGTGDGWRVRRSDLENRRSDLEKWIAERLRPAGSEPKARNQKLAAKSQRRAGDGPGNERRRRKT